ncbi:MAG: hypothetical protein SCARUB_02084 [Candidatus Scalindua rubra]|uniref:Uncharacterized protein n=1 Tax=Candidatus Scalindua rubra TaxID=1872076 RepID=A0A1E3XCS1_9BACT|nr:MAG: hypothetical protein SCARUB_02084 [Candidatus Scalindua rubra]
MLTLGKASELAEMDLWRFVDVLNDLKVPVIDYDKDELAEEFKIVKEILR